MTAYSLGADIYFFFPYKQLCPCKVRHTVADHAPLQLQKILQGLLSLHGNPAYTFLPTAYRKSTVRHKGIGRRFVMAQIVNYIPHSTFFLASEDLSDADIL